MRIFIYPYLLVMSLSMLCMPLYAQQSGEVKDQEFIIRKDRVLTLPEQPRKFERAPVLPTPKSTDRFDYTVKPFFFTLEPVPIQVDAVQKQFPKSQDELYRGFVRGGIGNYESPLLEVRYSLWEEGDYNFTGKLRHQSFFTGPVRGTASAENFTDLNLDGTLFKDDFQLFGGIHYDRHRLNFYGFDPEDIALIDFVPEHNVLNTFKLFGGIGNIEKLDGINYRLKMGLRGFNDNFLATENEFSIKAHTDFWFDDYLKTAVDMDLSLTSPKDATYEDINRNFFSLKPYVAYNSEKVNVHAGVTMVVENDVTPNKNSDFHLFPALRGHYLILDEFGVYGHFEGDVIRNTYLDFVNENPFLGPSAELLNTIQSFKTGAGVKGTFMDDIHYRAGFNISRMRNMHFFVNTPGDSTRFNLVFDENVRVLNYTASVTWEYEDWYQLTAHLDYYNYNLTNLSAAFHRPEWEIRINNQVRPSKEWLIQANLHLMGGLVGLLPTQEGTVRLPAVLDFQVKGDYAINERLSAFVIGNNLFNRQNQRFLNYPVRGIQGIIGASYKF